MCTTSCAHNIAASAKQHGSTPVLCSSLLCFPGLLLPSQIRRFSSLQDSEVTKHNVPALLWQGDSGLMQSVTKSHTRKACLSPYVHLGSYVLLLHNQPSHMLSLLPIGLYSAQPISAQKWSQHMESALSFSFFAHPPCYLSCCQSVLGGRKWSCIYLTKRHDITFHNERNSQKKWRKALTERS